MTFLNDEIWYKIIRYYLPDYELYKLLFTCKFFCYIVKNLEKLAEDSPGKFKRKTYFFMIKYGRYFYAEKRYIVKLLLHQRYININAKQKKPPFLFVTTYKEEMLQFFKVYCMPIHLVILESSLTYPSEITTILKENFRFKIPNKYDVIENRISWIMETDSPIRKLQNGSYDIRKIFFYDKEIGYTEYFETYDRINSLTKLLASSYTMMYVLKCFKNMCIVDVIFSYSESTLPSMCYF